MKRVSIIALACIFATLASYAQFTTAGNQTKYTLFDLSQIEGSGVIYDGAYTINNDITIAATDIFELEDGAVVKLAPNVSIEIEGTGRLTPSVPALITALDPTNAPKGVSVGSEGKAEFKNVTFEYASISTISQYPLTVENCSFIHATDALSSTACIAYSNSSKGNVIRNCRFISNDIIALGTGANITCGIVFENNLIYDNNTSNTNRPMINLTTPIDNGPIVLRNNSIIGTGRNMVGGITVSNLMGFSETGSVIIEGNTIANMRYGINVYGPMDARVAGNTVINNHYENNPMNGGSGITCYDYAGKLRAILAKNHIEGSLWGVTILGNYDYVSLGEPENKEIDSPGENVFVNNGNDGSVWEYEQHPYDLYNNSDKTVYAQNNIWSVPEQTPELIETVIYHRNDDPSLGEVIFEMPDNSAPLAINDSKSIIYDNAARAITSQEALKSVKLTSLDGRTVWESSPLAPGTTTVTIPSTLPGIYILTAETATASNSIKLTID